MLSPRGEVLCFVHVERAGGTSLRMIVQHNHPSHVVPTPYRWPHDDGNVFRPEELRWLLRLFPATRSFGGHSVRSYLGYEEAIGRPIRYFTFVRDPIARFLSHYHHQVHQMRVPWTFEEFVADGRFSNFMTHRFAGGPDVELAKQRLAEDFAFVGLTDRFDESLVLFRHALGRDLCINYERENQTRSASYDRLRRAPEVVDRAREENQLDLELFDFARGLYEARRAAYPGDLAGEVAALRRQNEDFRFPSWLAPLCRAYRVLGYWVPEQILRRVHHPDEQEPVFVRLRYRAQLTARNWIDRRLSPKGD